MTTNHSGSPLVLYICYAPVGNSKKTSDYSHFAESNRPKAHSSSKSKSLSYEESMYQLYVQGNQKLPDDDNEAIKILSNCFPGISGRKIDLSGENQSDFIKRTGLSVSLTFALVMLLLDPDSHRSHFLIHEFKNASKACEAFANGIKPLEEIFQLLKNAQTGHVVSMFEYGMKKASNVMHTDLNDDEREEQMHLAWTTFEEVFNTLHEVPHLLLLRYETAKAIANLHMAMGHRSAALEWCITAKNMTKEMRNLADHQQTHIVRSYEEHVREYSSSFGSGIYGLLRTAGVLLHTGLTHEKRKEINEYNTKMSNIRLAGYQKRKEILLTIAILS
ncbi:hypothetical protein [Rivularia sp. UHCC 0363]|uniref:hypothetical protein n=1 Tax=Rivularia sp. UHCC 0363 TaxID=3110244 RepID=UPI002B21F892|nr:hypothetical protein [Rivularia sp. UHCC 0363]MEA5599275.1 hypothetical protein [Rivularia sp. UHCC 0363]